MLTYDSVASSCATASLVKVFLALSAVAAIINFSISMWQTTYVDDGDLAGKLNMDSWQVRAFWESVDLANHPRATNA
jgi:hypothetical protein